MKIKYSKLLIRKFSLAEAAKEIGKILIQNTIKIDRLNKNLIDLVIIYL